MAKDERRDANGCLVSEHLDLPIIEDLDRITQALRAELEAIAVEPRTKAKINREAMIIVIVALCRRHFVTLRCLAGLVNRDPESLRNHYLSDLVKERRLALAFPTTPNHERQAYCAVVGDTP